MTVTRPAPSPPTPGAAPPRVLLIALLGTLLLGILDVNVVTSAATSIGAELDPARGTARVPWLVTAYVVASCVVQPLYGKLADRHGAKPVFLGTVGLFMVGSALCAMARTMDELIAFRALQGLGGGGLMSVTFIVFGHLMAESGARRRTSAIGGVMVGVGLVVGPLVGGLLVDHASWRWVFLVNLPLAALAFAAVARLLHLPPTHGTSRIDPLGALLLAACASLLLLACEWGGQRYPWGSAEIIGLVIGSAAAGVGFAWRQTTAAEPFFPPRLLRDPILRIVMVLQVVAGIGLASATVYVTLDLQVVRGVTPSATGLHLVPMALGLGIGAVLGSRLVGNGGPVRLAIAGGQLLCGLALLLLAATEAAASGVLMSVALLAFGTGLGVGLGNELILVQSSVQRRDLGVATSGLRFVETIGVALGASAFGVLFVTLTHHASSPAAVASALHAVFAAGAVVLLLAASWALRLPDVRFPDAAAEPSAATASE